MFPVIAQTHLDVESARQQIVHAERDFLALGFQFYVRFNAEYPGATRLRNSPGFVFLLVALGQVMGYSLMAVYASLAALAHVFQCMFLLGAFFLFRQIHIYVRVAISAFARFCGFHGIPHAFGEVLALSFEFLPCADGA